MSTADGVGLRPVDIREKDHHDHAILEDDGCFRQPKGEALNAVRGGVGVGRPGTGENVRQGEILYRLGRFVGGGRGITDRIGVWEQWQR